MGTPQGASSNHEPDAVASSNDLLHGVDPGVPSRARGGAGFDDFLGLRESAPGAGESGTSGQAVTTPMADAGFSTGKGAFLSGENDGVEGSSSLFEDLSVKDGGAGVGDEGTQSSAAQPARVGNATGSGFSFMADGDEDPPAASGEGSRTGVGCGLREEGLGWVWTQGPPVTDPRLVETWYCLGKQTSCYLGMTRGITYPCNCWN